MEYNSQVNKRLSSDLKLLTTDPNVSSYFNYESSRQDGESKQFWIYGYLLPRLEPYKYGSFKVRITIHPEFPFKPPEVKLLTYIYHPAVSNEVLQPRFHHSCYNEHWKPTTRITQWIEYFVNIIDRPEAIKTYCIKYSQAKDLYDQNKLEYEKNVMSMIEKYSYPRANQSIISLKFAAKQMIPKQLDFKPAKINQLILPNSLKQYLDPSLGRN